MSHKLTWVAALLANAQTWAGTHLSLTANYFPHRRRRKIVTLQSLITFGKVRWRSQSISTKHLFVPMALVTQWEVAMRDLSARCVMGAMLSLALVSSAGAVTFTFEFDDRGIFAPPPALPPFVGTGTVTLATDPGPGTFALNSLGPFSMSFVFGTNTFSASNASTSEITTPLSQVLVALTSVPGGENLRFSNTQSFGGGAQGGHWTLRTRPETSSVLNPPVLDKDCSTTRRVLSIVSLNSPAFIWAPAPCPFPTSVLAFPA
jgi:hypothetical protein